MTLKRREARPLPVLSSRSAQKRSSRTVDRRTQPQPPAKPSFYRSYAFVTPSAAQNQSANNVQYIDWPNPRLTTSSRTNGFSSSVKPPLGLGETMSVHPAVEDVDRRFGAGMDIESTSAVDLLMDDWLDRFEKERWDFNSMAVYGEVKLLEAMKMTEQLEQPNGFVTALCCNLLGKLVPAFGPYVELMELLEEEIVRSIYYDYDKHNKYDRSNTRQLFTGITYDKKAKQYLQDIENLTQRRAKFEEQHLGILKDIKAKSFQVEQSIKQWHNRNLHASFRAWAAYVAYKKQTLAKTQKIFQRWVGSSSDLMRKVFHGWKIFRQKQLQEKTAQSEDMSKQQFLEIQQKLTTMRERVKNCKAGLESDTKRLAELKVELEQRTAELTDAQTRLAGSVDREAAVFEQAVTWAEFVRSMIQGCLDEFQVNYDHAVQYKELFAVVHDGAFKESGGANQWVNFWLAQATDHEDSISSVRFDMTSKVFGKLLKQLKLGLDSVTAKLSGQTPNGRRTSSSIILIDTDEEKEASLVVDFAGQLLKQFQKAQEGVHGSLSGVGAGAGAGSTEISAAAAENGEGEADPQGADASLGDKPMIEQASVLAPEESSTLCFVSQLMHGSESLCLRPWQPLQMDVPQAENATLQQLQRAWEKINSGVVESAPLDTAATDGAGKGPDGKRPSAANTSTPATASKRKPLKAKAGEGDRKLAKITDVPQAQIQELNALLGAVRGTLEEPILFAKRRQDVRTNVMDVNLQQCWEAAAAFANDKKDDDDKDEAKEEEPPSNPAVLKYGTIKRKRIQDLLDEQKAKDPEADWKKLCAILVKRATLVKTAYVSCAAGGNATMDIKEFWKVVKQCKMPDKELTLAEIDLIFQKVNIEDNTQPDLNDANPDGELLPGEFLEALIRVAGEKYKGVCKDLSSCVDSLMVKNLKPNVSELNTSAFRKDLKQPLFKDVIATHKDVLAKIFKKYTGADRSSGSSKTMSMKEWLGFMKDFKLMDARFSSRDATVVFSNSQDDGAGENPEDQQEMVYSEYVEAMTAVACYKVPDPFLTLELRMGHFLSDIIVPVYREKKRNSAM